MWRKCTNEIDALTLLAVCEAAERKYYSVSDIDGATAHHTQAWLNRFQDPKMHCWLYEDGEAKAVVVIIAEPDFKNTLSRACATGFDVDVVKNYEKATPIIIDKMRQVAFDDLGLDYIEATTMRTVHGKTQLFFIQAYVAEAESTLTEDGMGWRTVFRNKDRIKTEKEYAVLKTPDKDTGVMPQGYRIKRLNDVSKP